MFVTFLNKSYIDNATTYRFDNIQFEISNYTHNQDILVLYIICEIRLILSAFTNSTKGAENCVF